MKFETPMDCLCNCFAEVDHFKRSRPYSMKGIYLKCTKEILSKSASGVLPLYRCASRKEVIIPNVCPYKT